MTRQSKIAAKSDEGGTITFRNKHCNLRNTLYLGTTITLSGNTIALSINTYCTLKEHTLPFKGPPNALSRNTSSFSCTFSVQTLHFRGTHQEPLLFQGTSSHFQGTTVLWQYDTLSRNSHNTAREQRLHEHWRRFTLCSYLLYGKWLLLLLKICYCEVAVELYSFT